MVHFSLPVPQKEVLSKTDLIAALHCSMLLFWGTYNKNKSRFQPNVKSKISGYNIFICLFWTKIAIFGAPLMYNVKYVKGSLNRCEKFKQGQTLEITSLHVSCGYDYVNQLRRRETSWKGGGINHFRFLVIFGREVNYNNQRKKRINNTNFNKYIWTSNELQK